MNFAKRPVRPARKKRFESQEELAQLAGVSRQTISSIETRQYTPSALMAFVLAEKLDKPVSELFFLEGGQNEFPDDRP